MISHSNRALLLVLGIFVLGVILYPGISLTRPINQRDNQYVMSDLSLANLEISLSQASPAETPGLSISVTNTHPSTTLTLLKWDSPLDPLALQLGLISVTPAGESAPIDMPTIKISRAMPPGADSLVTLQPGQSANSVVELPDMFVPKDTWAQGKAKISMKGSWAAVWPGVGKDDLLADLERLSALGGGEGVLTGEWESPAVEFEG
ncbi:hypothetical protein DHEL01_v202348 [Diaporthe helianthi]|uniref:Uncharacterized protein n=1 Tax=Diaporthe helianthi TaxID=158607 RepID=A0A2P5I9T0_DIAHE|nr:hypothetical protein DHEL01_v202348 [Diaporthe helianthi]